MALNIKLNCVKLLVSYSIISSIYFFYNAFFNTNDSDKYFLTYILLAVHIILNTINFYVFTRFIKDFSIWKYLIILFISIIISLLYLNIFLTELVLYLNNEKAFLLIKTPILFTFCSTAFLVILINILVFFYSIFQDVQ